MEEKKYSDVEQEFWSYEKEGDAIVGIYETNQENVGQNKSMLYLLRQPNGKIIGVWGSTVLDNKFKLIRLGDDIRVVYLGIVKPTQGREYKDFKIQIAETQAENKA